ncbi:uncharacterized protein PG986_014502 [Apiospora aurea]|uniref:Uncharacterized protein n=1 Tax=Apiospora aurea TaxID=335848 RepID=A0ABR1PT62_9PEZI
MAHVRTDARAGVIRRRCRENRTCSPVLHTPLCPTYDPTIEDSYQKQVVVDGRACAVQVLDTAGQKDYSVLRDQWIQHDQSFFLVYSITSRSSFSNVRDLYANIRQTEESLDPHHLGPILLIGNKCDAESERVVSTQEGLGGGVQRLL